MSRDGSNSFNKVARSDFAVLHLVCGFVRPVRGRRSQALPRD